MTISEIYCFSSIPQPAASIYFHDFNKKSDEGSVFSVKEIINFAKGKNHKSHQTNSFTISSFADGAYPFYVRIDKEKKVKAIYFEPNNNCGWGSSMYFGRTDRLLYNFESIKTVPEDVQLDMDIAPAISVSFKNRNQKQYTSLNWNIEDKEFLEKKKTTKIKLGELIIKSNLITLDTGGGLDLDTKKIYSKAISQDKYYGVDDGLRFDQIYIPVKNNNYPVYVYHEFMTDKQLESYISNDEEQNKPIFPIISIQNIEGCYLSKDKDAKLIFLKEKIDSISDYLKHQISKKTKDIKLCQLDLENLSSLDFLNDINYNVETISFSDLNNIKDWSPILKIKSLKAAFFNSNDLSLWGEEFDKFIKKLMKTDVAVIINGYVSNNEWDLYLDAQIDHIMLGDELLSIEGSEYNGELNEDMQPHGFGHLSFVDGKNYCGYFSNGAFHGYGTFVLESGSIYTGEWKSGNQEGKGIFISHDGFKYEGGFKNNKYHGKGEIYIIENGERVFVEHDQGVEL